MSNCDKWFWMMNYCKENNLPPAQDWAWDEAKEAYRKKLGQTLKMVK